MSMKNTKLLKALLTIVTAFVIIFLPLWVGPEIGKGIILDLIVEWFIGFLIFAAVAIGISIIYYIITSIYDLWDDIIN
jgi:hypothetical protein